MPRISIAFKYIFICYLASTALYTVDQTLCAEHRSKRTVHSKTRLFASPTEAKEWRDHLFSAMPLREGSTTEHEILNFIANRARALEFHSISYPLDQVKLWHSFSSNLEILIPAQGTTHTTNRWAPEEQEIVFATAITGNAAHNIYTILEIMELCAQYPPTMAFRLVLLGSEHSNDLHYPAKSHSSGNLIGSHNFLFRYHKLKPWLFIYLYHPKYSKTYRFSDFSIATPKKYLYDFWHTFQSMNINWYFPIFQSDYLESDLKLILQSPLQSSIQQQIYLMYSGRKIQTPLRAISLLSQAFEKSKVPLYLDNESRTLQAIDWSIHSFLDPYLAKGFPIVGLHQKINTREIPAKNQKLSTILYRFFRQVNQKKIAQQATEDSTQSHYWLLPRLFSKGEFTQIAEKSHTAISFLVISEHSILLLLIGVVLFFAVFQRCVFQRNKALLLSYFIKIYSFILLPLITLTALILATEVVSIFLANYFLLLKDNHIILLLAITGKIIAALLIIHLISPLITISKSLCIQSINYSYFIITLFLTWIDFSLAIIGCIFLICGMSYQISNRLHSRLYVIIGFLLKQLTFRTVLLPYFIMVFCLPFSASRLIRDLHQNSIQNILISFTLLSPYLMLSVLNIQTQKENSSGRYHALIILKEIAYTTTLIYIFLILSQWPKEEGSPQGKVKTQSNRSSKQVSASDTAGIIQNDDIVLYEHYALNAIPPQKIINLNIKRDMFSLIWPHSNLSDIQLYENIQRPIANKNGLLKNKQNTVYNIPTDGALHISRGLDPTEEDALHKIASSLFTIVRKEVNHRYQSTLLWKGLFPIDKIQVAIVNSPSKLLYVNYPFSIAPGTKNQLGQVLMYEQAKLTMGNFPPSDLKIHLIFANTTPYELQYSIMFRANRLLSWYKKTKKTLDPSEHNMMLPLSVLIKKSAASQHQGKQESFLDASNIEYYILISGLQIQVPVP